MNWVQENLAAAIFCSALAASITPAQSSSPTPADAQKFIESAEQRLFDLGIKAQRAAWVQENFITIDTEQIAADAGEEANTAATQYAKEAHRFDKVALAPELARKRLLLELAAGFPAPDDPKAQKELAQILSSLDGDYGTGKWCPDGPGEPCLDVTAVGKLMATSRDPEELKRAWLGWHAVGAPMRQRYARMVELGDEGARQLGYSDVGALWRSNYDMPPDQFAAEMDRLWEQLRPLYISLHAYVRGQLVKKYGTNIVPPNGPIPAHLLGNIWAQEWNNVYELMDSPKPAQSFDLSEILVDRKTDARDMVKYGEKFFISLGFAASSATPFGSAPSSPSRPIATSSATPAPGTSTTTDDLRVKVCIHPTAEDFLTIHHELGHNFYQRAYNTQPPLFQNSANDGFHEAVGDTIALSVTPEYLKKIGLIDTVPPASGDIDYLLQQALEKVAFLPFGLLIDKWRWEVFSGQVKPDGLQEGVVGSPPEISRRRSAGMHAPKPTSIPAQNITSPQTSPTRATSSPASTNSSSTAPSAKPLASKALSTAAPSTATKPPAKNSTKCSASANPNRGPKPSKSSPGKNKWTPPP